MPLFVSCQAHSHRCNILFPQNPLGVFHSDWKLVKGFHITYRDPCAGFSVPIHKTILTAGIQSAVSV